MRFFCRGDNFITRGIGLADSKVFGYRAGFKPSILKHHSERRTKGFNIYAAIINSVNTYAAGINIIKLHQKIYKRRLAATRGTYYCNSHAAANINIQIFDKLFIGNIAEINIMKLDIALRIGKHFIFFRVWRDLGFLNQIKESTRAGNGILQLRYNAADFVKRLCVLSGIGKKA